VERHFRVLDDEVIDWAPGAVREYPPRSRHDYRLDARLTLYELRQLLIGCIIEYNTCHEINGYRRDKDMVADGVQAYPAQLWKWGVQNRGGSLRQRPPEDVRIKLLPEEKASVTPEGIRFKGLHYECERAWKEHWFEQARIEGRRPVPAAYDRRAVNRIYLRLDEGREIEECTLMPKDRMWAGFDWQDINDRRALDEILREEPAAQARQTQVEIHKKQEQIIRDAEKKTKVARKEHSNAELLQGIKENRGEELKREHQKDLLQSTPIALTSPSPASSTLTQDEFEEDVFMTKTVQWLRNKREKGLENAQQ